MGDAKQRVLSKGRAMEALRINNLPSKSFLCSKSRPSSSSLRSLRTQLACQPFTSLHTSRLSAIVEKAQKLEARADAESEEASAHASAEPNSSERPNDNVGSGHEEGRKAAEKMTPKAN